jgi:hypothetical protein
MFIHRAKSYHADASSTSSIMSPLEDQSTDEEDEDDDDRRSNSSEESEELRTLQRQWDALIHELDARNRRLQHICRSKHPALHDLLQRQENQVRGLERERFHRGLLLDKQRHLRTQVDASWLQRLRDVVVFEVFATIPAILSLILHCVAHLGIFDVLEIILHQLKHLTYSSTTNRSTDLMYLAIVVFGILLTRISGYLYWWCSDQDYKCVKFAMHNRFKLGMLDAKILAWIRQYDMLRCAVYTVGYTLIYLGVTHFYARLAQFMDQRERLLRDLPSNKYDLDVCVADNTIYTAHRFSCSAEFERLERAYEELREADVWFTWKVLSAGSHESYWAERNEGLDEPADAAGLFGPWEEIIYSIAMTAFAIAALKAYGFTFWYKY